MGWTWDELMCQPAGFVDAVWQWIQVENNPESFSHKISLLDVDVDLG